MSLTKLLFIRHATVDYINDPEADLMVDLSGCGREQAAGLSQRLADSLKIPVKEIYSSDLPRAFQTIDPFAKLLALNVTGDSRLREHNYNGDPKIFHEAIKSDLKFKHFGGETLTESGLRFAEAIAEIVAINQGQFVVVSTHGTVFTEYMKKAFAKTDSFYFELSNPDAYYIIYDQQCPIYYSRLKSLLPPQTIKV